MLPSLRCGGIWGGGRGVTVGGVTGQLPSSVERVDLLLDLEDLKYRTDSCRTGPSEKDQVQICITPQRKLDRTLWNVHLNRTIRVVMATTPLTTDVALKFRHVQLMRVNSTTCEQTREENVKQTDRRISPELHPARHNACGVRKCTITTSIVFCQ